MKQIIKRFYGYDAYGIGLEVNNILAGLNMHNLMRLEILKIGQYNDNEFVAVATYEE